MSGTDGGEGKEGQDELRKDAGCVYRHVRRLAIAPNHERGRTEQNQRNDRARD